MACTLWIQRIVEGKYLTHEFRGLCWPPGGDSGRVHRGRGRVIGEGVTALVS